MLAGQHSVVPDTGLVELLLGERAAADVHRALSRDCLPDALWRMNADDLIALEGVGPAGAARLLAAVEMSRRVELARAERTPTISTPEDVVAICGPQLRSLDREHFWALALNTKNRLLRIMEVSVGSLNASIVHPRELFKDAVRASAASIVVVHNHPSGDPTPSGADIQLTRRLIKAGDVLGIDVLDHVVIGETEHSSLRDLGFM
jgi:DNA repair protein RadC